MLATTNYHAILLGECVSQKKYIRADPPPILGAKTKHTNMTWASEAMAACLFGGVTPRNAKTPDNAEVLFKRLLERALPGYQKLLGPRYPTTALFTQSNRNVDEAFMGAAWRYSHLLGPELFPCGVHQ